MGESIDSDLGVDFSMKNYRTVCIFDQKHEGKKRSIDDCEMENDRDQFGDGGEMPEDGTGDEEIDDDGHGENDGDDEKNGEKDNWHDFNETFGSLASPWPVSQAFAFNEPAPTGLLVSPSLLESTDVIAVEQSCLNDGDDEEDTKGGGSNETIGSLASPEPVFQAFAFNKYSPLSLSFATIPVENDFPGSFLESTDELAVEQPPSKSIILDTDEEKKAFDDGYYVFAEDNKFPKKRCKFHFNHETHKPHHVFGLVQAQGGFDACLAGNGGFKKIASALGYTYIIHERTGGSAMFLKTYRRTILEYVDEKQGIKRDKGWYAKEGIATLKVDGRKNRAKKPKV